ncbi:MAG: DegT/DnrJ/EryC1/StrS family aminotransferase [Chitinophagaceae bacterium]|nr:DegT/DnrJ/EryC1/StrS family aminotransferase [Chitinophagaceae bacterium]MCB9044846.1 DegT/DnrJ/EryC1/StrS family aminotransferase [Chitinophagales bacterium]
MRKIDFAPPYIDDDIVAAVTETLRSGWLTTGPRVRELEDLSARLFGLEKTICVNSWSSGAAIVFKWLGIGPGDEVIVPAYTYAATALSVLHTGATPVMVDVQDDFNIDPEKIKQAITPRTKAIMCVDIGGWPCDYEVINELVEADDVRNNFQPGSDIQEAFGRPAVIADAAHSIGAIYDNRPAVQFADISIISMHSVKNITTAEGGIICLSLPEPFNNEEVYRWMKLISMNGQDRDAFAKKRIGSWRYDIVTDGLKANLTDVCASIGLTQLRKYNDFMLPERRRVYDHYTAFFKDKDWAIIPPGHEETRKSSHYLYQLRIKDITEEQRDDIIQKIMDSGVSVNVHFLPLPTLTVFSERSYKVEDYPNTYRNYACEISLPIYVQLTDEDCAYVEEQVEKAYIEVVS